MNEHPVKLMAFWNESQSAVDCMSKIFDELAEDDNKKKKLVELLKWAFSQGEAEENYNNQDFS